MSRQLPSSGATKWILFPVPGFDSLREKQQQALRFDHHLVDIQELISATRKGEILPIDHLPHRDKHESRDTMTPWDVAVLPHVAVQSDTKTIANYFHFEGISCNVILIDGFDVARKYGEHRGDLDFRGLLITVQYFQRHTYDFQVFFFADEWKFWAKRDVADWKNERQFRKVLEESDYLTILPSSFDLDCDSAALKSPTADALFIADQSDHTHNVVKRLDPRDCVRGCLTDSPLSRTLGKAERLAKYAQSLGAYVLSNDSQMFEHLALVSPHGMNYLIQNHLVYVFPNRGSFTLCPDSLGRNPRRNAAHQPHHVR